MVESDREKMGVPATPSGSRKPDPSCTGSGPTGFDPSRLRDLADKIERKKPRRGVADWADPFEQTFRLCFPKPEKIWADGREYEEWTPQYTEWQRRQAEFYELLEASAELSAAFSLLSRHTLWAVGSMEDGPFARLCWPMPDGGYGGGYVEAHAGNGALSLLAAALRGHAIAMEAAKPTRREAGSARKGDSAGPKDIAQRRSNV